MPMIHNFVKSPIKDRIKMLFHSKSNKVKKLIYLLALPVAVGLFWLFAVQVVYAQNIKDEGKPSKDFYQGTLKGKVLKFKKEAIGFYTFDLLSDGKIYPIEATNFKEKIKVGDELIAYIMGKGFNMKKMDKSGKVIAETNGPIYNATKVTTLNGNLIYEWSLEKHAFLYEANKVRFASSKIKSIQKGANGKIEKIVLNDGLFTISLNLTAQNIKNNDFKVGDRVLVKFIGEKLVSKNTYTTDKLIMLYSKSKKYLIKNETLYNRFYFNDGKQKVAAVRDEPAKVSEPVKPKIISFSKITGDTKNKISYMNNAVIDIINCRLEAEYVELDQGNNKMVAKNASLKNSKQNVMVKSNLITFDLKHGGYSIDIGDETKTDNDLEKLINSIAHGDNADNSEVEYSARDSVKINKDKSIISLFGNAKVFHNKTMLSGTKIVYNKKNSSVMVNNATMMSSDNKTVKADSIYFDLKTTKARLYGADFKR
jgi:lipopolysaccharide export system protein LptA